MMKEGREEAEKKKVRKRIKEARTKRTKRVTEYGSMSITGDQTGRIKAVIHRRRGKKGQKEQYNLDMRRMTMTLTTATAMAPASGYVYMCV